MRAARIHGHKDIRIDTIPEPECTPGTVKIRPLFTGICGSDLHAYFVPSFPWVFKTHPLTLESPPLTLGHEFTGVITELAPDVDTTGIKIGDRVVVNPVISDGVCGACVRGTPNCCVQLGFLGLNGWGGGLSEKVVVGRKRVHVLPEGVGSEVGAMVEPLAVGWHGVRLASTISPTTRALVIGSGPVGCAVILALRAHGVTDIAVSEPSVARRAMASNLGASLLLDPSQEDVVAALMNHTANDGVDAVFDCAGVPASLNLACAAVRSRGDIVNLALWGEKVEWDVNLLMGKEASWRPSMCYTDEDIREVIEALAEGKMEPGEMITGRIGLENVVRDGFEVLHGGQGEHCKILVDLEKEGRDE